MKKITSIIMALMTVAMLFTALSFSASAASVVPSGAKEYKGHTYYVYKSDYTWAQAKKACEKKGGHLVTITSAKENEFVRDLISKTNISRAWLGASDSEKEGTWKWVTGEKFSFSSWSSGRPDNYNGNEDYLTEYYYNGTWDDYANETTNVQGFVCEWDCSKKAANSVRLNTTKTSVYYGDSTKIYLLNTSKSVKWTTSNSKVAIVSSKGTVTGKGLGTATITATVGSKSYKCKVTVTQKPLTASTSFKVTDGGYFILGEAKAKAAFRLKSNCAKLYVRIVSSEGDTIVKKVYTNIKKNDRISFIWDGKDSDGNYVKPGSYRMKVSIGGKNTYSAYLSVKKKGDFAGGNGSKSNPFEVATTAQFKKISKYASAYFVQAKNLDFDYTPVGNFFSADNPFNGVYDGNGKTISNISSTYPIFNSIGAKGQVKNVNFDSCTVKTKNGGIIANTNYGKITNCTTSKCIVNSSERYTFIGLLLATNYGYVSDCTVNGVVSSSNDDSNAGGIVGNNATEGKIISCISNANVTNYYEGWYDVNVGGISGSNAGLIRDSEVTGTLITQRDEYVGGISGYNGGQIVESFYTGTSYVSLAGKNAGTIM